MINQQTLMFSLNQSHLPQYRVIHLVMDLGGVDFDLDVPLSCPFCQIVISPSKIGQTVAHRKSKSSQPGCMVR